MSDTACATCMQPYWDCRCAPAAKEPGVRRYTFHNGEFIESAIRGADWVASSDYDALAAQVAALTAELVSFKEGYANLNIGNRRMYDEIDKLTAENLELKNKLNQLCKGCGQ